MKQLFEILIIRLESPQQDVMIVGQREERARHPVGRHGHAQLAPPIVLNDPHAFKAQLLAECRRVALDLQTVAVLTAAAQLGDAAL